MKILIKSLIYFNQISWSLKINQFRRSKNKFVGIETFLKNHVKLTWENSYFFQNYGCIVESGKVWDMHWM